MANPKSDLTLPHIEKGVPIAHNRSARSDAIDWSDMQVGDSILFNKEKHMGLSSLNAYAKRNTWKLTRSRVSPNEVRVWRKA